MPLPPAIAARLKPGLMARPEQRSGAWTLYEPISDLTCILALSPADGELGPADLATHDRAWSHGRLNLDLYHQAQRIRRHVDAQEANLEINYLCRYACKHCFQHLEPASASIATPVREAVIAAAQRLIDGGAAEISITGGDIFLQPAIWDLLDFLHQQAPQVTLRLLVNGGGVNLDDPEVCWRLERLAGRRVLVKSDFFGHTPELHDGFTRVPGSFAHLVRLVEFLRSAGIACLPAAALTRENFETRFELVNFLYHLSGDSYTVSSIIYPSDRRTGDNLQGLRLNPAQFGELLVERFFAPLAAEYHTCEPQCGGDCQFAAASASGEAWGCSFLKVGESDSTSSSPPTPTLPHQGGGRKQPPTPTLPHQEGGSNNPLTPAPSPTWGEERIPLPLIEVVDQWRTEAQRRAVFAECSTCPARHTCRRCPSFIAAGQMGDGYCTYARLAAPHVHRRATRALEAGYTFVDPMAGERLLAEVAA